LNMTISWEICCRIKVKNGVKCLIMELWLIRHGTTKANLQGRLQGRLDFPLGDQGKKEAYLLGRRLHEQRFSFFFCSPLQRARQTASIIAAQGRTPKPIYTSLLAEYDWGVIQGMTKAEIGKRYPEILQRLQRDFHHAKIPGAEGMSGLFYRVRLFYALLSRIAGKRSGQEKVNPILIVSHGRFLQAFIIYFLKYNYKEFWPFSLAPASLTILQGDFQRTRRLRLFNDTCHLSGMSRNVDEHNENMKI